MRKEGTATPTGTRLLFDTALGKSMSAAVFARVTLASGNSFDGPAVIVEDETTIIVPISRKALALPDGCIELTVKEA